jgi:hypothetical protein
MQRESHTHGPRQDEALKQELEGVLKGTTPSPIEDWLPEGDEDPVIEEEPRMG